jgi:hypothetical protein
MIASFFQAQSIVAMNVSLGWFDQLNKRAG